MNLPIYLLVVAVCWGLGESKQKGAATGESPPGNHLGERPPLAIDPKLRRALLRVLSKLELEERDNRGSGEAAGVSGDHILSLFDQTPTAEEPGNVEDTENNGAEKEKIQDSFQNSEFNYIPPTEPAEEDVEVKVAEKYPPTSPTPQVVFVPTPIDVPAQVRENDGNQVEGSEEEGESIPPTANLAAEEEEPEEGNEEGPKADDEEELKADDEEELKADDEEEEDTEEKVVVDSSPSLSEVYSEAEPKTNSTKEEKHTVEFFPSSLVAAFTVQQDDRGIPRKVIPLDYGNKQRSQEIQLPPDPAQRQRELAERKVQLEQELRLLRQQQEAQERELARLNGDFRHSQHLNPPHGFNNYFPQVSDADRFLQEQARRKQQEILLGQQSQLEYERQREIGIQNELERQREVYRQQELQRQQYHQERLRENINFQRSVDFQFNQRPPPPPPSATLPTPDFFNPNNYHTQFVPGIELNRVNRQESSLFVGNFGTHPRGANPDRQLQSLFLQSGVAPGAKEDLSIVSEVLALNHGGGAPRPRAPSSFVQPPNP